MVTLANLTLLSTLSIGQIWERCKDVDETTFAQVHQLICSVDLASMPFMPGPDERSRRQSNNACLVDLKAEITI